MSIRQGLMALLAERPMHGYLLRQQFEARTGGTWPLNIGQVYTTLTRLQRDGLVAETDAPREDGAVVYALTDAGRDEVHRWWTTPVERTAPSRDELAIKLALAVTSPGVDVPAVVQRQRTESLRALQEYTRLKLRIPEDPTSDDVAWSLVLDSLVFAAEAEVRWLDHVEQQLAGRPLPVRPGRLAGAGAGMNGDPEHVEAAQPAGARTPGGTR
ncbi:MAG: PadR family transcriptional regulator [Kineosporiaceae bacterium]